ncbi:hypothetical protein ACET3Z_021310 [Daucus carota]
MADQLSSSVELGLKLSRRVYYAEGGVDLNSLPHHQGGHLERIFVISFTFQLELLQLKSRLFDPYLSVLKLRFYFIPNAI